MRLHRTDQQRDDRQRQIAHVLLLVSFGIIEWLLEHVLHFESREKNMLLDGGIALAVFLGVHRVRRVVEGEAAPIQVADIDTVLKAAWALPMVHRGNLSGFILLGSKSNNDTYRPDEIEVLGFATHQLEAGVLRDQLKAAMQLLKGTGVIPTR